MQLSKFISFARCLNKPSNKFVHLQLKISFQHRQKQRDIQVVGFSISSGFKKMYQYLITFQHTIFYTQICIRYLYLAYLCKLGLGNMQKYGFWEFNLEYLFKETKLLLMFECHDSLDYLLVQFLQKVLRILQQDELNEGKEDVRKSSNNMPFIEKIIQISVTYDLSYVGEWANLKKDEIKIEWEKKYEAKIQAMEFLRRQNTKRKSIRFEINDKKDKKKQLSHQKKQNIVKQMQIKEIQAKQRLTIYCSNKKKRMSESFRKIYQQKSKYITKSFAEELIVYKSPQTDIQKQVHEIKSQNIFTENTEAQQKNKKHHPAKEITYCQESNVEMLVRGTPPRKKSEGF